MASVLPYVRGVDFTANDFKQGKFPERAKNLTSVQWLNLDRTGIQYLPDELEHMTRLEDIKLSHNKLQSLHGELSNLSHLKSVIATDNELKDRGIPPQLFKPDPSETEEFPESELQILDLSKNQLTQVPKDLESARGLIVLNLSHNEIKHIKNNLFIQLIDLMHLDLSHNKIDLIPPQLRRLTRLQHLNLSSNPLKLAQLRQIPSLSSLKTLNLADTGRNAQNTPMSFETLKNLEELSFARNELTKIPDCFFTLKNTKIKRIDLSCNEIDCLPLEMDNWSNTLEILNVSDNKINSIPASFCRFVKLRRIYINDNELDFEGLPKGLHKLINLEYFYAANNLLEIIPDSLLRCPNLKRLIVPGNRLITLPDTIHFVDTLEKLDVTDNEPNFHMPPKIEEMEPKNESTLNGIDFSLAGQIEQLNLDIGRGDDKKEMTKAEQRRQRRIQLQKFRRENRQQQREDASKVLNGMNQLHGEQQDLNQDDNDMSRAIQPKDWRERLAERSANVDYYQLFGEATDQIGKQPGITMFQIEYFKPIEIDQARHGEFYVQDCYIVLHTFYSEEKHQLDYTIYYWIGSGSSVDKQACAAMHAVHLRNLLSATGWSF